MVCKNSFFVLMNRAWLVRLSCVGRGGGGGGGGGFKPQAGSTLRVLQEVRRMC